MTQPYLNRLTIIREMLRSPHSLEAERGLILLRTLLQEYPDSLYLRDEVGSIANDCPDLRPKLIEMTQPLQNKNSQPEPVQPLAKTEPPANNKQFTPKIFISYSHKDENFKDELITMLAPLSNNHIIEIWHDRKIEEGDEWKLAIKEAMLTCHIALLLISKHFLASSFITTEELPDLLERRKKEGLRVVPIIIRDCMWQNITALSDLQALPRDGKSVVSFTGTAKRDKVWTEIARAIESRAKKIAGKD
jgi:hypothetical protein